MASVGYRDLADPHGVRADMSRGRYRIFRDGVLVDSMPDFASALDLVAELRIKTSHFGGDWKIYDAAVPFEDDSTIGWTVLR